MNSERLVAELGEEPLDPWPRAEEHWPTHEQWHFERNGELGSPTLLARVLYRNQAKSQRLQNSKTA